jgi:hypothetical protein
MNGNKPVVICSVQLMSNNKDQTIVLLLLLESRDGIGRTRVNTIH